MTEQAKTRSKRARQRKGCVQEGEGAGRGRLVPGRRGAADKTWGRGRPRRILERTRSKGQPVQATVARATMRRNPSDWRAMPMIELSLGLPPTIRRKNTRNVIAQ